MVVSWPELLLLVAVQVLLLLGAGLYVRFRVNEVRRRIPQLKKELFAEGEQWIGGAIGRFMQALNEEATKEGTGEGPAGGGGGGGLDLGGFKLDAGTIRSIAEILKVVQSLGFLKGGAGGGGGKIGL